MTSHPMKLVYFDIRGRAEVSRLVMAAAGKTYEDVRISFASWAEEKPNTPFGQLPYLVLDGMKYSQSVAIANYLARECGMYGKTHLDALKIEQVVQLTQELVGIVGKLTHEKDADRKVELGNHVRDVDSKRFLGIFEKILETNNTGFFVGSSLTVADIFVFELFDSMREHGYLSTEGFPGVQRLMGAVENTPKIKHYLANRAAAAR